jgi:hypothetical protein
MLRESAGEPAATMSVWRRGRDLLARVENAGGLTDLRAMVRLGERIFYGGSGVRAPLPPAAVEAGMAAAAAQDRIEESEHAIPFSIGFEGRAPDSGGRRLRRWSGGIGSQPRSGAPGRLQVGRRA